MNDPPPASSHRPRGDSSRGDRSRYDRGNSRQGHNRGDRRGDYSTRRDEGDRRRSGGDRRQSGAPPARGDQGDGCRRGSNERDSGYPPRDRDSGYTPRDRDSGYPPRERDSGYPPRDRDSGYTPRDRDSGYPPRERDSGYTPRERDSGYTPRDRDSTPRVDQGYKLPRTGRDMLQSESSPRSDRSGRFQRPGSEIRDSEIMPEHSGYPTGYDQDYSWQQHRIHSVATPSRGNRPTRCDDRTRRPERNRRDSDNISVYEEYLMTCLNLSTDKSPNLLIDFLTEREEELNRIINTHNLSISDIRILINILTHRHFTDETPETVHKINAIYEKLLNTPLLKSRQNVFKFIQTNFIELSQRISTKNLKICTSSINSTVKLLRILLSKFNTEYQNLSPCIKLLYTKMDKLTEDPFMPHEKEAVSDLYTLLTKVEAALKNKDITEQQAKSKLADPLDSDEEEEVKNYGDPFRCVPIFPTYSEIEVDSNVHLRELIVKGEYPDFETYLDIHFKLLREDMVYPLKIAIRHLQALDINFVRELYTYDNVRLESITTDNKHGVIYRISFRTYGIKNLKNFDWAASSRLKFGALLCISQKNALGYPTFENPLWAVVTHSDQKELKVKSVISIKFESGFEHNFKFNTDYFMVESREMFFEAYCHILTCLQEIKPDCKMPFVPLLLAKMSDCVPPKYIDEDTMLEFGDLLPQNSNRIKVLSEWPKTTKLNDSQYRAMKLAFTKQLALIQGPPGTGKTLVGIEIMKILLTTRKRELTARYFDESLHESICKHPILVITQSNHALDQFLEMIMETEGNVVRLGSRSESEVVKKRTLFEVKREALDKKAHCSDEVKKHRRDFWEVKRELEARSGIIERYALDLQNATNVLKLTLSQLKIVASVDHYDSLLNRKPRDLEHSENLIESWLNTSIIQVKPKEIETHNIPLEENPFELLANIDLSLPIEEVDDKYKILERRIDYLKLKPDTEHTDGTIEPIIASATVSKDLSTKIPAKAKCKFHMNEDDLTNYSDEEIEVDEEPVDKESSVLTAKDKIALSEAAKRFEEALAAVHTSTKIPEEILKVTNVWKLSQEQRELLSKYWLERHVNTIGLVLKSLSDQYLARSKELQAISNEVDLFYLQSAAVIGMTTTGAAKNAKLIKRLQPRIIVVEEAAEVLEAHILASLSDTIEHLIMIGDHQQLRPSNSVYYLAQNYNLNLSLFERLINNNVEHVTLDCQHRMRPEISNIMKIIYPVLTDHEKVTQYKPVRGVTKNTFFISHEYYEDLLKVDTTSSSNLHEALFVVQLSLYLIKQGYSQDEITILTFYNGQRFLVKELMAKEDSNVEIKVRTIDKYQGEENTIVILSVVRGNEASHIGHCIVDNRVCVAFSRAKEGFFVIGHERCLRDASEHYYNDLWSKILNKFKETDSLGPALALCCANHNKTQTLVSSGEDFKDIKHGGCDLKCHTPLPCSHLCPKLCHPDPHKPTDCQEPCTSTLSCGHPCTGTCGENCDAVICPHVLDRQALCGHPMKISCGLLGSETDFSCNYACKTILLCRHTCSGYCGMCRGGYHNACPKLCDRMLMCGHKCKQTCHYPADCPPCFEPCSRQCTHSKCLLVCGDICLTCPLDVPTQCLHYFPMKCSAPSKTPLCTRNCELTLKCKHPCLGLCSEPCPKLCRVCNPDDGSFDIFFGEEAEKNSRFVTLPDCGHIFELAGLDDSLKSLAEKSVVTLPCCPNKECTRVISTSQRYHNSVKRIQSNVDDIKYQIVSESKRILLEKCRTMSTLLYKASSKLITEGVSKALPILQNVIQKSNCGRLFCVSELINILTNLYRDGYPPQLWSDKSPLDVLIQSKEFNYFLDEGISYNPERDRLNLSHLKLLYRQCPIYCMFKITDPGSLSYKDKESFTECKDKFNKITHNEYTEEEQVNAALCVCEMFLHKIRGKYCQPIPICHFDAGFRRKVSDPSTQWKKCQVGHFFETTPGVKQDCPACNAAKGHTDDIWEDD